MRLDRDPERELAVALERVHHGGATDADYSGVPDEVVFGAGLTGLDFTFAATDDGDDDDGESVVVGFGSLPAGVTGGEATTLAILDDDGDTTPPPPPPPPPGGGSGGGDDDDEEDDGGDGGAIVPPRAAIRVDAECADGLCRALTGVPVRLEDASTGSVFVRLWDFGGQTSRRATVDYAFPAPGFHEVTLQVAAGTSESTASLKFLVEAALPAGTCRWDVGTLCLQDSRFAVTAEWWTADGGAGAGRVVHEGTNDSGLFHFFAPGNWEVLIKVLDGCALNGHVWVFGASTTNLGYRIAVTDTVTGAVREYRNDPGLPAPAITDVTAFAGSCGR